MKLTQGTITRNLILAPEAPRLCGEWAQVNLIPRLYSDNGESVRQAFGKIILLVNFDESGGFPDNLSKVDSKAWRPAPRSALLWQNGTKQYGPGSAPAPKIYLVSHCKSCPRTGGMHHLTWHGRAWFKKYYWLLFLIRSWACWWNSSALQPSTRLLSTWPGWEFCGNLGMAQSGRLWCSGPGCSKHR